MPFNSQTIRADHDRETVVVAGLLKECRRIMTRKQKPMLLGKCEDLHGEYTVLMFENDRFEEYADIFQDDHIVLINGKVRVNQDEISVMADKIEYIERSVMSRQLFIDVNAIDDAAIFAQLKETFLKYKGSTPVYFKDGDVTIMANQKYWISEDPLCFAQLEAILGAGLIWMS